MNIRLAQPTDLSGLLALYQHLNPEPAPDPGRAAAAFTQMLQTPGMNIFLAEVEGVLASSCTLMLIPNLTRGARPYGVIENVVTLSTYRKQGLGQAVIAAALAAAWAADCYKVMLASGSKQEATLRFYETAGFERGGKTFFQARR